MQGAQTSATMRDHEINVRMQRHSHIQALTLRGGVKVLSIAALVILCY